MRMIKEVLDDGVGFAIMEKLPLILCPGVATTMHWLLGSLLGNQSLKIIKMAKCYMK